eukprot:jgi/Bigna1/143370/aug1.78_g18078
MPQQRKDQKKKKKKKKKKKNSFKIQENLKWEEKRPIIGAHIRASIVWISSDDDAVADMKRSHLTEENGYGTEAFEDMFLLAECDHQVGTISSHFSVIPALLRFLKGHNSLPVYMDIEGASKKKYQASMHTKYAECLYKALEKVNNRDKRAAKRGKSASKESKRFRRNIMHTLMALKANTGGLIEAYMPLQIRLEEMNCLPPGGKMEIVSVANRAADLFDAGDRDWSRACFGLALLLPGAEEHKSQVRENFIALGGKLEALKPSRGGGGEVQKDSSATQGQRDEEEKEEKEEKEENLGEGGGGSPSPSESTSKRRRARKSARKRRERKMKDEDQAPSLAAAHSSENEEATTFMKEPSSPSSRSAGNGDDGNDAGDEEGGKASRRLPQLVKATRGKYRTKLASRIAHRLRMSSLLADQGGILAEKTVICLVESEKKCQQLCIEKGSECHGYVYHSEKMAKPWQSRCAYLDRDTIRFSGLLLPDSWLRMEGVVSATKE